MKNHSLTPTPIALAVSGIIAAISLSANAFEVFQTSDTSLRIDTNLSMGSAWRAKDTNYENVGRYNAAPAQKGQITTDPKLDTFKQHRHFTGSQDNADLRWEKDKTYSELVKATVDVEAEYQDYGALVRSKFFYDNAIVKDEGGNTLPAYYPTTDRGAPAEPRQRDGKGGEILDAFVWANWMVLETPISLRLGKQVVNWGEGTLFPNGINTINPVDVNALLAPGAEVKEALIPVNMLYTTLAMNNGVSIEAFYQFEWEKTRLPACGTFFNTSDLVGDGCNGGFYPFALEAGTTVAGGVFDGQAADNFKFTQADDIEPDNGGQFGLALRHYWDLLHAELGFYYVNYHSQLPISSGYAPDQAAFTQSNPLLAVSQRLTSAHYAVEYPEDIHMFGVSLTSNIDFGLPGGETAVAGEISYRNNQPFQIEDSALLTGLLGASTQLCNTNDINADGAANCLDLYAPEQFISGAIRDDFYQAEISFVHFFDQVLGADKWVALLDIAYNYANIPDKSVLLMNSAYNTDLAPHWTALQSAASAFDGVSAADLAAFLSGGDPGQDFTTRVIDNSLYLQGTQESRLYPTRASYGYKLRLSGEYNNVFSGVNLVPTVTFNHDVKGVTPGPIANFLEDRKALGLSLEANYLSRYRLDFSYTDYFGAEPYNQLNDRDYYSVSAGVSF